MHEKHNDESRFVQHKAKWRRWLGGNEIAKRLVLALSFLIFLTCFLHFREVRMESLEIGTSAKSYVIAQIDFDFLDVEATDLLKREASRDIGAIYQVNESQIHEFRDHLENALIENQKWRQELPNSPFEELYISLDMIEDQLVQARFTDHRTFKKMQALGISTEDVFIDSFSSQPTNVQLPKTFWQDIEQRLEKSDELNAETIEYVVNGFSANDWVVQQDFSLEGTIKQRVKKKISDRYTRVDAGSQIIKPGEKVTPRHIAMVRAMKQTLSKERNLWTPVTLLGSAMLALCLTVVTLSYINIFHRDVIKSLKKMTLLLLIVVMGLLFARGSEYLLLYEGRNFIEAARFPLLIPFAAMMLCVLISAPVAMVSSVFLLVVMGVSLAVDYIPFILINFFACLVTILLARKLHKRKEVFSVCAKVWICSLPVIVAFNCIKNSVISMHLVIDVASSFAFMVITALLTIAILPLLEALFEVMTDMTLMEYMDPDHELLRRLSLEAPGTYQHCLVVGNLSEAAARAIGANGLFCRVSTLYHDIGKLFNPHYFTENQLGGFNIHHLLTPQESTHVIIAHVPEGETLARKYNLPQSFIDIIREHHGTTMVYYFYCKQVEQMSGDATKVNERLFRYPGPKPRSKESAIIMIADTIEAASRSMDEITEEVVADMIDKLVAEKANDGQFDECQLTFEELGLVKRSMVKSLMVTRHLRIKYPEKN